MADKDARVRLNLSAAGLLTQLREVTKQADAFEQELKGLGDAAEKSNRKTGALLSTLKTGFSGAKSELGQLGGQLKSVLGMAATLGGSISLAGGIQEARALTTSYKDMAFAIRRGSGDASVSSEQVQATVERVAGRWKRANRDVADSYLDLYKTFEDSDEAEKFAGTAAMTATATGANIKATTAIVNELGEKFGVTGDRADEAMAKLISRVPGGKAGLEELGENLGLLGATARSVGLASEEGLGKVLGMLNATGATGGKFKKELMSVIGLLEQLGDADQAKNIEKILKVKITNKDGSTRGDALERIIASTGGKREELSKVFSGPVLRFASELGKVFQQGADAQEDKSLKTAAGLDALRGAIEKTSKGAVDAAGLRKEADGRLGDSQRNLDDAINRFTNALSRPEVVGAIDQAAAAAPKLAGVFGDLITFATKHPVLAGGAVIGGVAAKGALTAVVTKVSEGAMESAGTFLSKAFAAQVKADGAWGAAGKAFGVAAAALIAYQVGKNIIDASMDKDEAALAHSQDLGSTAESMAKHGTGSAKDRADVHEKLAQEIARMEKEGPGLGTRLFGSIANAADSSIEHPENRHKREIEERKRQLAMLRNSIIGKGLDPGTFGIPDYGAAPAGGAAPPAAPSGPSDAAKKIAEELNKGEPRKVAISNEEAMARAIGRQVGIEVRSAVAGLGQGTNGLPPAPGNTSGSAPKS